MDDVVIFGKITAEVIEHTYHLLDLMCANNLKTGGLKYYFLLRRIQLLQKSTEAGQKFLDNEEL